MGFGEDDLDVRGGGRERERERESVAANGFSDQKIIKKWICRFD